MSGKLSRNKGKGYEREIANELKPYWGENVKRGWQSRAGDEDPDVDGTPFWIECKRGKKTNHRAAFRQAEEATDGRPVLVFCRDDREETIVSMKLSVFKSFLDDYFKK